MQKDKKYCISKLLKTIKSRDEVRLLLPLGYIPGMPIISIKNEQLVAMIPFLRYKKTGEKDRTLVYPIKYVLEYLIPEEKLVVFKDLSLDNNFANINFNQSIGFFRHDAIKSLDKEAYDSLRNEVLNQYDSIVNFLITGTGHEFIDERKFKNSLQMIIEPFLTYSYAKLDIDFYNKYIKST